MQVTINGEVRDLGASNRTMTIDDLLVALALPVDRVAVEHNGSVVRRADRALCTLSDGDVVEIVTLVGGG
jgi:thiamine biosynthesis protein ThiS